MTKYAIKLTKNDDVTILGVCETEKDAIALGADLRKKYTRDQGLLAMIEAEFDENNQMIGNRYKLLEVFR